jgi:hypothetical protein
MNSKQHSRYENNDTARGPFNDGLTILARIISRVYRKTMLSWRLYFYSPLEQSYVEWPTARFGEELVFLPVTCVASEVPLSLLATGG